VSTKVVRIAVLLSGSGSNLQAIIDYLDQNPLNGKIVLVLSNRPETQGLERAKKHNISTELLDHTRYESRESFDQALSETLKNYTPDLVVLAGFMRILTPDFVEQWLGKIINIHPSLLPKYPGLETHRRALESQDTEHGATVHFVTAQLDGGPAIIQASVTISNDDDEKSLATKVLAKEHVIYPLAVKWFVQGRLTLLDSHTYLDNEVLGRCGVKYSV